MIDIKSALEKSNKTSQGLASLLWPESNQRAQYQNLYLLMTGKNKSVTFDQVHVICEYTGVDANFLFKL